MAIIAGYTWSEEFTLTPDAVYFPDGVALRAQVRDKVGGTVLTTLTTADDTLERVSDTSVRVTIPAADSAAWTLRKVVFDIVRTDAAPDTHYGFRVEVPVVQPVTVSTDATP